MEFMLMDGRAATDEGIGDAVVFDTAETPEEALEIFDKHGDGNVMFVCYDGTHFNDRITKEELKAMRDKELLAHAEAVLDKLTCEVKSVPPLIKNGKVIHPNLDAKGIQRKDRYEAGAQERQVR